MIDLSKKSVLVLGLGETGLSLVRWLSHQGAQLRVADSRAHPPALIDAQAEFPEMEIHCGAFHDNLLTGIAMIAISPGVPLQQAFVQRAAARGIDIVGDVELFAQAFNDHYSAHIRQSKQSTLSATVQNIDLPSRIITSPKIIAITGSNGKSTVTDMVGNMCRAAGLNTVMAGNISPAVLDALLQQGLHQPEVWVLELSSFQLESTSSLNVDAATVLNISEDHLDRYNDMRAYSAAKARIFQGSGVQILNRDDPRSMAMALPNETPARTHISFGLSEPANKLDWGITQTDEGAWLIQGQRRILQAAELQVAGLHNVANALAALALCRAVDIPLPPLLRALKNYQGLPHRVERVAEIDNVLYYDDSKGTNVGATVAALQGLQRPTILIAGGEGKGQDFSPLLPAVSKHARAVVLIGRDAPLIAATLSNCGVPIHYASDMVDAVQQAASMARAGDAVLLSPACASFDMFKNYVHRASVFVGAVQALQEERACSQPV